MLPPLPAAAFVAGITRSGLLSFYSGNGNTAVAALYSTVWVVNGYPRAIQWEQTGDFGTNAICGAQVTHSYSELTELPWKAACIDPSLPEEAAVEAGKEICPAAGNSFAASECGFSTLPPNSAYHGGKYTNKKFDGMGGAAQVSAPRRKAEDSSPCFSPPLHPLPIVVLLLKKRPTGRALRRSSPNSAAASFRRPATRTCAGCRPGRTRNRSTG
eukprot:SAG22_NODE_5975_length_923_cov_1.094660_2_plen_214_part_00